MSSPIRRLMKNSFIYGSGDMLAKALAFLLLPLYTRFLTPEDYGILSLCYLIITIFSIVCSLGVDGAISKYHYDVKNKDEEKNLYGSIYIFSILTTLAIVVFAKLWSSQLSQLVFASASFSVYIDICLLIVFFSSLTTIPWLVYKLREQSIKYSIFSISSFLLKTLLIIYFVVFLKEGAQGSLKGQLIGYILIGVVSVYLMSKNIKYTLDFEYIKKSLKFGLPLIPHSLAGWVITSTDRFMLGKLSNLNEVGLYTAGYNISTIMWFTVSSIQVAWVPFFFSTVKLGNAEEIISTTTTYYVSGILFLALFLAIFSKEIAKILVAPNFYQCYQVIPLLVCAALFQGFYYICVLGIFQKEKTFWLPFLTGFAAIMNIGLNFVLIPRYGMVGASFATTVSYFVWVCLVAYISQKVYPIRWENRKLILISLTAVVIYLLSQAANLSNFGVSVIYKSLLLSTYILALFSLKIISFTKVKGIVQEVMGI